MFNPSEASKKIKEEFIDYICTSFSMEDKDYNKILRNRLYEDGVISKGPLIDINDVFKIGRSIENLCSNGEKSVLSPLFKELESQKPNNYKRSLPINRPLYLHQEKAIDVISVQKKNAVITTGTGSGKTECFLIPIINELLREIEKGETQAGIRALLIYPMNALANDQMKRLRKLLMCFPKIKFAVYNGDTKWEDKEALSQYCDLHETEEYEELRTPLENELISRKQINENPPHILCTNYAMLEHMLLRPENDNIFKNSKFKFVVLDEAHVYSGATGMETSLLLRRLKARINSPHKVQFILTSATLGEQGKSENDIINFANNLSGEVFDKDSIIYSSREDVVFDEPINNIPIEIFEKLSKSSKDEYPKIFKEYDIENNKETLYNLCRNSIYYRKIRDKNIFSYPIDINELAQKLNITKNQAIAFIHICTMAEVEGRPLVDARYHFFVRAIEGMYTSLYGEKQLFLTRKNMCYSGNKEIACFERVVCTNCGELGIVGKIEKENKLTKLRLVAQYDNDAKYFHIKNDSKEFEEFDVEDADLYDESEFEDEGEEKVKLAKKYQEYNLCPVCGAINKIQDGKLKCECGVKPLIVSEFQNANCRCLGCQSGKYRRFYIGTEAATGVLATSLFEELPYKEREDKDSYGNKYSFIGGKQFLAFSDSRSEAAFFASYLDKNYKEFLRRRGVMQLATAMHNDLLKNQITITEFVEELIKLFVKKATFSEQLNDFDVTYKIKKNAKRNAWIAVLVEMVSARRRNSLVSLGKIAFSYIGNNNFIVEKLSKKYDLDPSTCKNLLDYLALSIVSYGALYYEADDLEEEDKKYVFYTTKDKYVKLEKSKGEEIGKMGWLARNREGKADSYYPNMRVKIVARVLNSDEKTANKFLEDYFNGWLINPRNPFRMQKGNSDIYSMPVDNYSIHVFGDKNIHWYKCDKCGKVSVINLDGKCLENGCCGNLVEILDNNKFDDNHFLNLYKKEDLKSLIIKEHTAQLSREEGLEYQTKFEKNYIHALSCSTTFEMGVDVGELETVFLRNVPPSSANYAQRVGRAGRSIDSASYSLTYAKLSSHDFHYFNNPKQIINGIIKPPVFKIDNQKIVLRHIYSVVLSKFFNEYPEYFGENKTKPFLEDGGFEKLLDFVNDKTRKSDLDDLLNKSIPNIQNYAWENSLLGEEGVLSKAVNEYKKNVVEINELIEQAYTERESKKANILENILRNFQAKQMIDFLVRNNILPKYGFPIDSVELVVDNDVDKKKSLHLSRDLKMAISEYAPGEKVIANNKMYTSRYIKKSFFENRMDFHKSYVCKCSECGTWNYKTINPEYDDKPDTCFACKTPIAKNMWNTAIEPRGGFIVEKFEGETVPLSKPEKIYHSQDSYIGDGKKIDEYKFSVKGNRIILKSSENDSIMVTSNTRFYVCERCGYAYGIHDKIKIKGKIDKEAMRKIKAKALNVEVKATHKDLRGYDCANHNFKAYMFNHIYKTDVVIIDFVEKNGDYKTMQSVLYALLNAMSNELGMERDDIGGCLKNYEINKYMIVLYDTVAGGAGHVRRILNKVNLEKILRSAYDNMRNCNCDSSCYNCLRNYYNQRVHQELDRTIAAEFLADLCGEIDEICTEEKELAKELKITNVGYSFLSDSYGDIIDNFDGDDCVKVLLEAFSAKDIKKPDYNDLDFEVEGIKGYADLCWKNEKILVFAEDNIDSYNLAKQTNYNCFIVDNNTNYNNIIELLK